MPKQIDIRIISSYDAKGSTAAAKALADLTKAGGGGAAGKASADAVKQAQAYAKVATAAGQVAAAEAKKAVATSSSAAADSRAAAAASNKAAADSRAVTAATNSATADIRKATATSNAAAAQDRAAISALRLAQAQTKAASGGNYFKQVGDGVASSIMGMVGPVAVASAAFGAAAATVQSFADAFKFKAALDATTLSVNAQLKGVRESGQVWAQASTFAQKFKLTQQETTQAVAASIGVMRSSKASVEDILGVLARMQVLSPEQSLEEAAIALKALASGDTTSLVTRFEVGRDVANQMKQEIQGGADAVQVMSKFLGDTGIGMDVLAAKTEGASGKMKDLAIAQENLKLAQADFAQGPGMVVLEGQIRVVTGATRLLSGDFDAMGQSIHNAIVGSSDDIATLNADMDALQGTQSQAGVTAATAAEAQNAYTRAILEGGTEAEATAAREAVLSAAMMATAQATQVSTDIEQQRINVLNAAAALSQQAEAAEIGYASALEMSGVQARAGAMAAQMKSDADRVAAVDAQTHGIAEQMLAQQAQAAAQALLNAGPAGARTAALLAGSSQQVDVLTAAYYRLAAAQQAAAAAPRSTAIGQGIEQTTLRLEAQGDAYKKIRDAREQQIIQTGTEAQKQQVLQTQLERARVTYGQNSVEFIRAQTSMTQAQKQGGSARVSAAGAAATKLEGIETKTGDKLSQIVQDTQAKLIAIDKKAADERAKIAADLANKIATSATDRRASNEADDLELIGVTDEKQAQQLNDREKAQAAAREREVAAAKEAQDAIANGEAESASKVYDIREKQISDQQALDEKYAEKQRELAGDEAAQAALKQQYDEATRANEEAANTRIAIAKAESEQKKAEVQAEKDAVIAAANEQANQVVSAAERSAAGVTKATGAAKAQATADLRAIGDAVTAIPAQKTITITVKQDGAVGASSTGGGSATAARARGGDTNTGRVTLVGEQGPELVVFDTPGQVYPAGKTQAMLASGAIPGLAGGGTIDAGGGYTTPIAGAPAAAAPKGGSGAKPAKPAKVDPKKALDEMKNTIQLLMDMAKLKEQIASLAGVPAFDIPVVQALVQRAQEFTAYVNSHLVPLTKNEGEALGRYLSAARDAVSLISDTAGLKKDIAELKNVPAFDQAMVLALIDRAEQFTRAVQQHLIPLTEFERDQIGRYTQVVGDVVGMLRDVADLKKELATPQPAIDTRYIDQLVADAAVVTVLMQGKLVPTSEAQADAMSQYASVAGDTIGILNDVIDLGKNLKENGIGVISDAMITKLADQAKRITELVSARLVPATKEQSEAFDAYASLVSSSTSALKDVADLGGKLFTDYTSPTDAQIALLATDAKRITDGFFKAGALMGKEGAEAGKAYAEGVGAAFSAAKDGLLVIDALKSGDFVLPEDALGKFEGASLQILDVMQTLGARAAAIPTSDIAALSTITASIAGQAEALIKLAAVPFGDLAGAAGGLGQGGGALGSLGGTTTITNYNTFNLPPGSNQQTAQEVIRILNQQMGTRR